MKIATWNVNSVRARLQRLLNWLQRVQPDVLCLPWWDYRMLAFPKNDGLRLDYVFATEPLAQRCTSAEVDREQRKGEKPSDHAPVVVSFAD